MCVIIEQKVGYTLPKEMLQIAMFNNPHGYGLVVKDPVNKKVQVTRKLKSDFEEVYDLLTDNEDCIRYLHLRWKTEGDISEENVHPFCVFHSDARQVYFMHNGTLPFEFKPKQDEKISDSKKFNDQWLVPFLTRLHGPDGKGDYHDEWFIQQLQKVWSGDHNRGLIVSNDLNPLFINHSKWEVIKDGNGGEFFASNNTYFTHIVRGPEFERRKKEKEEAEKSAKKFQNPQNNIHTVSKVIVPLKNIDLKPHIPLSSDLSDIFEDVDLYSGEGYLALAAVVPAEFDELCLKHPETASNLLLMLSSEYKDIYYENKTLVKSIKAAQEKKDLKELPSL